MDIQLGVIDMKIVNLALKIALLGSLLGNSLLADAAKPVVVKTETTEYILDYKYPQDFQSKEVNAAIKDLITVTENSFMGELIEDAGTPADAPGKTSLTIKYNIPYQAKNALSVRFIISTYHRGAAHPAEEVKVLNFINGHGVKLADLFKPGAEFLKPIAAYSAKEITAKNISDAELISEGTAAKNKNYKTWYFTKKGIDVVFNTYQVAAYVYGEQVVAIPTSIFSAMLKPEIAKQLWGN